MNTLFPFSRQHYDIPLPRRGALQLGRRTLVMGIVNVTPDSFGERAPSTDSTEAIELGLRLAEEGADILDVGGESTRPGAQPVDESEEIRRVVPVIAALSARADVPISVDTTKARVADEAMSAGAEIVNDISGLRYDPALGRIIARSGAACVLMHMRGRPGDMYRQATYEQFETEVSGELLASVDAAVAAGVDRARIILDPGVGFAKRPEHSFRALTGLRAFAALGYPVLVGPSRKSFLQAAIGECPPADREWATGAAITAAVLFGAHIVRVHAVQPMVHVVRVADRIRQELEERH